MGFGKGGSSQPSAQETAQAQAQANRINQRTPFGNLTFSGANRNTATTTLSPAIQAILNQQLAAQEDAARRANILGNTVLNQGRIPSIQGSVGFNAPANQFDDLRTTLNRQLRNLPGVRNVGLNPGEIGSAVDTFRSSIAGLGDPEFNDPTRGDLGQALSLFNAQVGGLGDAPEFETTAFDRTRIEDALFNRGRRLLDPVFESQEEGLRQRLANQGLPQGQEAFTDELDRFETGRSQSFLDLADRAVLAGGAEADRVFGQDLAAFDAALRGRGQGFSEALSGLGARTGVAGQQFGQGIEEFGADLARRQQLAGEIQQEFANRLGGQELRFGQNLAAAGFDLGERQQRALEAFQRAGTAQGLEESELGRALSLFGVRGQQRQQGIERELLRRQIPLNELQALLGLSQTQQPGFFGPGQVDVIGAQAVNNQLSQQQLQNRNNIFGSLIGVGGTLGAAALLCDPRAKIDLGEAPTHLDGIGQLKIHAFRYRPGHEDGGDLVHIGPMADEFHEIFGLGDGRQIPIVDAFAVCLLGIKELKQRVERLEGAA